MLILIDTIIFLPLIRASRSLNNNIESAQHEAMIAAVFCDEVKLTYTR